MQQSQPQFTSRLACLYQPGADGVGLAWSVCRSVAIVSPATRAQQLPRWATVLEQSGPKSGGLLCPFPWGRAASPSNTMWPWPRPTSVLSGILIHPVVWPQYTNVTDRQDRQRSDSIGRTVLLTVAPKRPNRSRCRLGRGFGWA